MGNVVEVILRGPQGPAGAFDADNPVPTSDIGLTALAPKYYQATVTTSAQTLAALIATALPAGYTAVIITPETGDVRYRADGIDPTATVGQPIAQGQAWPLQGAATLSALKLIASTSITVSIEFRG